MLTHTSIAAVHEAADGEVLTVEGFIPQRPDVRWQPLGVTHAHQGRGRRRGSRLPTAVQDSRGLRPR